jgi:superfamily I DNA/RNA helicase
MPHIVLTKIKEPAYDKDVKAKIFTFLQKLQEDDTSVGLNIEKMANAADSRARTARVDISLRAVLYRMESSDDERVYVYAGTWDHDEAGRRAQNRILRVNPVNGITELIEVSTPDSAPTTPAWAPPAPAPTVEPYLNQFGYAQSDLVWLGLEPAIIDELMACTSEDALIDMAATLENQWQGSAVLSLAVGEPLQAIAEGLMLEHAPVDVAEKSEDDRIIESLRHPASQMQFTMIENDEELRKVLDAGDFGAWRVFLHPEQRKYASTDYNGPFRLSGGAGTGKTVVLLHRARYLQEQNPKARIVLTTYTKALAGNLQRDLERLDPALTFASELGQPGILVRGIDGLASDVRTRAGGAYSASAQSSIDASVELATRSVSNRDGWKEALDDIDPNLPETILNPSFFEAEYLQVVLPGKVVDLDGYLGIRRPGRGTALDRAKRREAWKVIQQYRKQEHLTGRVSFAEVAEVSAAWLADEGPLVDHVLIDEGQDLVPSHWRMVRAIVPEQRNDLFIAEDTHQRIYGSHVVLSRYGIKITGRSRRLSLNYRTTEENLRYALAMLDGGTFVDSDNTLEGSTGYRSIRRGPIPQLIDAQNDGEQLTYIAELVQEWLEQGVAPGTIAVLARSNSRAKHVQEALMQHGLPIEHLTSAKSTMKRPVVLTMHTAKGMEFSRVVLFDISEGSVPMPWVLKDTAPEELPDVMLRERSLLYVAASRARDELVVTWKGERSELLTSPR